MHERIEDGLLPRSAAARIRHDRSDHIHKLRQTCDLHSVRMLKKRDQHQSHQQRILECIDILQHRRRHLPRMILRDIVIRRIGMEPYIPLVKADIDILAPAFLRLHIITGRDHRADEFIHIVGLRQEVQAVIVPVAVILVHGDIVYMVISTLKGS